MNSVPESGTSGRVPAVEREVETAGEVPPSVAFRILADDHRRFLLYQLVERGGTVSVDELVAGLAGTDAEATPDQGLPGPLHRRLFHNHLPRLSEHGIVDYDREAEAVSLTEVGETLAPYAEFAMDREGVEVEGLVDD